MSAGIRDLKVWQEATGLAADVVRALRPANRREVKTVIDDAMRCAEAVALCIADGYARYEPADQHRMYTVARQELARLETHLGIGRQADMLSPAAYQQLCARMQLVQRLLAGLLVYLDRQVTAAAGRREASAPGDRPAASA